MPISSLILFILSIAVAITSLVFGIKFLIKYNQTREKGYLFLGIILTFIIPAFLFYIIFKSYLATSIMYGPSPMMEYGPGPI